METGEKPRENKKLLALLGALFAAAVIGLLIVRHRLLVAWPALAVVAVLWAAFSALLRARPKTWGRERPVLDWWSVPHGLSGVILGLFGLGLVPTAIVAIAWEGVEIACHVREYNVNRVTDVILAFAGWILANLVASGAFTTW